MAKTVTRRVTKIRKKDKVQVIAGKDKGKSGVVLNVLTGQGRALVEKINYIKRHTKPRKQGDTGGIIEKEAPINLSNLMVVCSHCNKPTRLKIERTADGKRIRKCQKCGEIVDK